MLDLELVVCVSIRNVEFTRGSVSPDTNNVPVAFMYVLSAPVALSVPVNIEPDENVLLSAVMFAPSKVPS